MIAATEAISLILIYSTLPAGVLLHHLETHIGRNLSQSALPAGVLLHHLETHIGIVVLITNKPDAIDTAFQRRIRFSMSFPMPDSALRWAITFLTTHNCVGCFLRVSAK